MNIEISGIFPANRGALLMLEAIRQQFAEAIPDARLAVPLDWSGTDRLRQGVWGTPGSLPKNIGLRLLDRAPWHLRDKATFIRSKDIDVLLDASGFGYGDFWGVEKLSRRLADRLEVWKTGNQRAVLLPQALGPFTHPGMADAFARAVEKLDAIYVRDQQSFEFACAVVPDTERLRRAPDFTNLLRPRLPERLEHLRSASLVIPNEKMVGGKGDDVYNAYIAFLVQAVEALRASGRSTILLLHEGVQDVGIAEAVNNVLAYPAEVVNEPSAMVTKAVVGAAELIVSSRFHGLVSAVSAGVPALACGWSHKYQELMNDYGCGEMLVDLEQPEAAAGRLSEFITRSSDPAFRASIAGHAELEKIKSRAMWAEVMALISQ